MAPARKVQSLGAIFFLYFLTSLFPTQRNENFEFDLIKIGSKFVYFLTFLISLYYHDLHRTEYKYFSMALSECAVCVYFNCFTFLQVHFSEVMATQGKVGRDNNQIHAISFSYAVFGDLLMCFFDDSAALLPPFLLPKFWVAWRMKEHRRLTAGLDHKLIITCSIL